MDREEAEAGRGRTFIYLLYRRKHIYHRGPPEWFVEDVGYDRNRLADKLNALVTSGVDSADVRIEAKELR